MASTDAADAADSSGGGGGVLSRVYPYWRVEKR